MIDLFRLSSTGAVPENVHVWQLYRVPGMVVVQLKLLETTPLPTLHFVRWCLKAIPACMGNAHRATVEDTTEEHVQN
jgi:hypothetical protein